MRRLMAVVTASGALAVVLTGCIFYPGQHMGPADRSAENIGGVRFWQTQAVPGFDSSEYTLSDDQVDRFRDLLIAHDIDPGDYRTPQNEGCTGGVTTRAQLWFHMGGDKEMIIDGCAAPDGSFEQEATDFFSAIRTGSAG
ncbi:MAG TPA: hypothetical protein VL294_02895 [Pseudolysinimonas sp.]|nr:hypothetical protein [Pseudolysinimonas sp.]